MASPTSSSSYSFWTPLGNVAVTPRLELSASGTRALLTSVRTDGISIEVRESTNSGGAFGASTVIATAGGTVSAAAGALLDGTGSAAVLFASGGTVFATWRTGTGAWSAPAAWTHTLTSVSGLAVRGGADYEVLVSGVDGAGDAGVWATLLGAGALLAVGAWDALSEVTLASAGTGVSYLGTSFAQVAVPRAAVVESLSGGGSAPRVQVVSGVAGSSAVSFRWRDPLPFAHASAHGVAMAADLASAWLSAPHGLWHASATTPLEDLTEDVLELDASQSLTNGRLRLVLRNDDGRYHAANAPVALEPRSELRVDPGYVTTAGAEQSSGPRYWITSIVRRHEGGAGTLEIEAVNHWGVLRAWSAPRQFSWAAGSLAAWLVIDCILGRAGLRLLSSGSAEAVLHQPAVTVRAGQDGASAVRRVLEALPDELRPELGGFRPIEPLASDATDYAYGLDHPLLAVRARTSDRPAGWSRVLGSGVFGEAVDDEALRVGAASVIAVDDNLTTQPRVDARAQTLLRQSALASDLGEVVAPVNAGQEVGDVIELTDATAGLDATHARVTALRLRYIRGGARPRYDLTLSLSEV